MKKILKRLIVAITLLIAIAMAFIYANILIYAKTSVPLKSDAIVVLGCQVQGSAPSLCLQYRLEKALDLYKKGYGNYIIVSGGQGKMKSCLKHLL